MTFQIPTNSRQQWTLDYAKHKHFCLDYFGGRGEHVLEQSKLLSQSSMMGPIEALDICMQIEAEFPGRVEEFVDRAREHPRGMIWGLMDFIKYIRANG